MLNIQELIGFAVLGDDAEAGVPAYGDLNMLGRFIGPGIALSANHTVTVPAGTGTLIFGAMTQMNSDVTRKITSITVGGQAATPIVSATTYNEYRSRMQFWALKNPPTGDVTMTITHDTSSSYGYVGAYVWSTPAVMRAIGLEDTDWDGKGADPLAADCNFYQDGFALAIWDSYGGSDAHPASSITYFNNSYSEALYGSSHVPCAAWMMPTADVLNQAVSAEDGTGGNDGQTLLLASFAPSRFDATPAGPYVIPAFSDVSTDALTTYTFPDIDIGADSADRSIVVAISGECSNLAGNVTNITFDGLGLGSSDWGGQNTNNGTIKIVRGFCAKPGTTGGDLVLTTNYAFSSLAVSVYIVRNLESAVVSSVGWNQATNPLRLPGAYGVAMDSASALFGAVFWKGDGDEEMRVNGVCPYLNRGGHVHFYREGPLPSADNFMEFDAHLGASPASNAIGAYGIYGDITV